MRKKVTKKRKLTYAERERKFAHLLGNLYTLNIDSHDVWCDLLCDDDGDLIDHMMTRENYDKLNEDVWGFYHEEVTEPETSTDPPLRFG
jgi:hypothetical protein